MTLIIRGTAKRLGLRKPEPPDLTEWERQIGMAIAEAGQVLRSNCALLADALRIDVPR